ncbi:hypothetical protein FA15DRAFT_672551 [Coprinopsis marcescibilis]|uniref:Uncharacterized protein n=1 Tax=Coprinopsis marcescibilis TaxID=230819 RepID=A0A5C3KML5_COPMA|nr:hypothetical protein FA15DRAFT_672551 [Coprinopsis marcescibilis]
MDAVDGVSSAENELSHALDELECTGALQRQNRMDISFLVNCPEENVDIDCATDEEIYEAVMEARAARENMDVNGGDDNEPPQSALPAPIDVRKAVSTISDYLIESNEPYARKLEGLLNALRHDLRLKKRGL